ncbi:General stress protein 69 [Methylobacterium brachiatum]|nr:General stress protein 69 [Methylobacterium brachiatum]
MERRPFGPVPREIAVIGQETWYIDDAHRPTAVATLRRGLDLGMTHIDTAEMYGDAETVVGEAITERREEVFLVSKVLPSNATRAGTVVACERSLARLRTDRLDCYLLHWPGPHPLEDTFAGFERLREQGKILSWGVSNFDVPDLNAAWKAGGEGRIACNQVLYHLQERAIGTRYCRGVRSTVSPRSLTAHSAMAAFPARTRRGTASWERSRRTTARPRVKWPSASWCGDRRCSRSPRHPAPSTSPTTRPPPRCS